MASAPPFFTLSNAGPGSPLRPARALRHLAVGLTCLLLAACGGGVTFGFGFGSDFDDSPPSISLAASSGQVRAGQTLRLIAAAADETGIDAVIFFRFDGGEAVSLGSRNHPPYEIDTVAPNDGRSAMSLFARAYDNAGNRADSPVLKIDIVR